MSSDPFGGSGGAFPGFHTRDISRTLADQTKLFESMERNRNELFGRNDAQNVFEHLQSQILDFQADIEDDREIGIQLANFGVAAQIHIRSISFCNPNLIKFVGVLTDGTPVKLVQHISQLSFLLLAVQPLVDEEPYRVGFNR